KSGDRSATTFGVGVYISIGFRRCSLRSTGGAIVLGGNRQFFNLPDPPIFLSFFRAWEMGAAEHDRACADGETRSTARPVGQEDLWDRKIERTGRRKKDPLILVFSLVDG